MIKVLIVDDHQLVRAGLVGLLEQEPGIQVINKVLSILSTAQIILSLYPKM